MRLYVNELVDELSQRVKPSKNTQVEYIRPHLYLRNIPPGPLTVQICSGDGLIVLAESEPIEIESITESLEYHGYVTFAVRAYLHKDTWYTIKIVADTNIYFYDPNDSWCGVVNDVGFKKYEYSTPITDIFEAPLDLEIWSSKKI